MCESYIGATEKSVARIRVSQAGQFIRSMFWIGCIGFGGGSALIPVIEKEIADRQGIDEKQNIDYCTFSKIGRESTVMLLYFL